jgi:Abnormal spindle-like microcephaly-assoc'd, ASPM-SPD-2-Hydin
VRRRFFLQQIIVILSLLIVAHITLQGQITQPTLVIRAAKHDTSAPWRDLVSINAVLPPPGSAPVRRGSAQPLSGTLAATTGLNFEGLGQNQYGFVVPAQQPPDTNGAVGATEYVQFVNTSYAVFDKASGALIFGPVKLKTLFAGFGGPCSKNSDLDVIAQYDKLANRWLLAEPAVTGGTGWFECVAVSTTPDATGPYNRYAFQFTNFPDYPKLGVWPDAYYASFNMFSGSSGPFLGVNACALDRKSMLNGAPATAQCFMTTSAFKSLLPSDLDGSITPPSGSPNFFMNLGTNALNVWKFHVDWNTPANSTFTGPTTIPVKAFTRACGGNACIPQPSTTVVLRSFADRIMYRLAYRHFADGHEAIVATHAVGSPSAIRWYEIRNPNGTPSVFQQGTFSPNATYRWMPSIGMDSNGDIGVGYNISSSTVYPGIAFAGRAASDALGTFQGETTAVSGSGFQTVKAWGDYAGLSVDPVDDCTFWYTSEYMFATGSSNWHTRIASFGFPACTPRSQPVTLSATGLQFGGVVVGNSAGPLSLTLTNQQAVALNITKIGVTGDFSQTNTCGALPAQLGPNANCTIHVTFSPTAKGQRVGTLTITDNASTSPQTANLSGMGQ